MSRVVAETRKSPVPHAPSRSVFGAKKRNRGIDCLEGKTRLWAAFVYVGRGGGPTKRGSEKSRRILKASFLAGGVGMKKVEEWEGKGFC